MKAELVIIAQPAVGAEPSVVVPAGETWKIHTMRGFLTASGASASREVRFIVNDLLRQNTFVFVPSSVTQVASEARTYQCLANGGYRGAGSVNVGVVIGIGDVIVPGGSEIRFGTTNIDSADQWGPAFLIVQKFKD